MSYLDRLKNTGICPPCTVTKVPKGGYGTYGTKQTGASSEIQHAETVLQAFIDLVRAIAAGKHGRLLHRAAIERELNDEDRAVLSHIEIGDRQAWAELLAHRLTRPGPGWEDAA